MVPTLCPDSFVPPCTGWIRRPNPRIIESPRHRDGVTNVPRRTKQGWLFQPQFHLSFVSFSNHTSTNHRHRAVGHGSGSIKVLGSIHRSGREVGTHMASTWISVQSFHLMVSTLSNGRQSSDILLHRGLPSIHSPHFPLTNQWRTTTLSSTATPTRHYLLPAPRSLMSSLTVSIRAPASCPPAHIVTFPDPITD